MEKNSGFPQIEWADEDDDDFGQPQKQEDTSDEFAAMISGEDIDEVFYRPGDEVEGVLISKPNPHDQAAIDLGSQAAGVMDGIELCHEESGEPAFSPGDKVKAFVVGKNQDAYVLSRTKSQSLKSFDDLQRAYSEKIPVKGRVQKAVKGGFEIGLLGKTAFCPISKIDIGFVSEPGQYIGKDFEFYVEKLEARGRNIVVDRAKLLNELNGKVLEELVQSDYTEKEFTGTVTRLESFGAFISFHDVLEGMAHISQLSHIRVSHPSEILRIGESVRFKILKIENDRNGRTKMSLSIKAASQDPWERIYDELSVDSTYDAKVVKLMDFGAFVEIKQMYEGLIHVSEMSWLKKIRHPKEILSVGDHVKVQIKAIDSEAQKLSLTLKYKDDDPWVKNSDSLRIGAEIEVEVERLKSFGAIANLLTMPGMSGLLPLARIKQAFGESYRKKCSPGQKINVTIADIDRENRKILFSIAGVEDDDGGKADFEEYLKSQSTVKEEKPKTTKNVGSFGALLAATMEKSGKD